MRFIFRGKAYHLEREQLEEAVRGAEPEPIRKHYVVIRRRQYPVKQPIRLALGFPSVAFTTQNAYEWLSRLGYELGTVE